MTHALEHMENETHKNNLIKANKPNLLINYLKNQAAASQSKDLLGHL